MSSVKAVVVSHALELGFDLVRVTSAQEFAQDRAIALERLKAGLMDGLPWYSESRVRRGASPQELLPGARSVICLGLNYYQGEFPEPAPGAPAGRVARYAWQRDYHQVMKKRMRALVEGVSSRLGTKVAARWYVDDGPMLDRAAAHRSGLGWFGKNTNILTPSLGSWVFLGQVITDLEIEADRPLQKTCGACVRCIDACPTGAIVAPYVIDNARCISYLTIENRGPIPVELRPQMQDWVFGCDICQDVCPVNRKARPSKSPIWESGQLPSEPALKSGDTEEFQRAGGMGLLDLVGLLEMNDEEFKRRFRGTPILRAKRAGLQRNACVALGNRGDPSAIPALCRALAEGESLVRGHAAWALGRIGTEASLGALERAWQAETDPNVLKEISAALGKAPATKR
jgi:epoxyqueuosine reductase